MTVPSMIWAVIFSHLFKNSLVSRTSIGTYTIIIHAQMAMIILHLNIQLAVALIIVTTIPT